MIAASPVLVPLTALLVATARVADAWAWPKPQPLPFAQLNPVPSETLKPEFFSGVFPTDSSAGVFGAAAPTGAPLQLAVAPSAGMMPASGGLFISVPTVTVTKMMTVTATPEVVCIPSTLPPKPSASPPPPPGSPQPGALFANGTDAGVAKPTTIIIGTVDAPFGGSLGKIPKSTQIPGAAALSGQVPGAAAPTGLPPGAAAASGLSPPGVAAPSDLAPPGAAAASGLAPPGAAAASGLLGAATSTGQVPGVAAPTDTAPVPGVASPSGSLPQVPGVAAPSSAPLSTGTPSNTDGGAPPADAGTGTDPSSQLFPPGSDGTTPPSSGTDQTNPQNPPPAGTDTTATQNPPVQDPAPADPAAAAGSPAPAQTTPPPTQDATGGPGDITVPPPSQQSQSLEVNLGLQRRSAAPSAASTPEPELLYDAGSPQSGGSGSTESFNGFPAKDVNQAKRMHSRDWLRFLVNDNI